MTKIILCTKLVLTESPEPGQYAAVIEDHDGWYYRFVTVGVERREINISKNPGLNGLRHAILGVIKHRPDHIYACTDRFHWAHEHMDNFIGHKGFEFEYRLEPVQFPA